MTVSIIATAPAYTGTIGADADTIFDFTGSQIALDAQTANTVLAGPASGAAADPAFRALVNADLPNPPLRVVTDATTELAADANGTIICNKGTAMTVDLLAATGSRRTLKIKNIGAGVVTVDASGAETIDGATTQTLNQWDAVTIVDYASGKWAIV